MKQSLGPRTLAMPAPVWLVATYDAQGRPNFMTIAWGGICSSQPPCVTVSLRSATYSHSAILARKSVYGEHCVEFPGRASGLRRYGQRARPGQICRLSIYGCPQRNRRCAFHRRGRARARVSFSSDAGRGNSHDVRGRNHGRKSGTNPYLLTSALSTSRAFRLSSMTRRDARTAALGPRLGPGGSLARPSAGRRRSCPVKRLNDRGTSEPSCDFTSSILRVACGVQTIVEVHPRRLGCARLCRLHIEPCCRAVDAKRRCAWRFCKSGTRIGRRHGCLYPRNCADRFRIWVDCVQD